MSCRDPGLNSSNSSSSSGVKHATGAPIGGSSIDSPRPFLLRPTAVQHRYSRRVSIRGPSFCRISRVLVPVLSLPLPMQQQQLRKPVIRVLPTHSVWRMTVACTTAIPWRTIAVRVTTRSRSVCACIRLQSWSASNGVVAPSRQRCEQAASHTAAERHGAHLSLAAPSYLVCRLHCLARRCYHHQSRPR